MVEEVLALHLPAFADDRCQGLLRRFVLSLEAADQQADGRRDESRYHPDDQCTSKETAQVEQDADREVEPSCEAA